MNFWRRIFTHTCFAFETTSLSIDVCFRLFSICNLRFFYHQFGKDIPLNRFEQKSVVNHFSMKGWIVLLSGCHSISGSGRREPSSPSTLSTPTLPRVEYKKLLPMFNSKKLFKGYSVGGFSREPVAIKELRYHDKVLCFHLYTFEFRVIWLISGKDKFFPFIHKPVRKARKLPFHAWAGSRSLSSLESFLLTRSSWHEIESIESMNAARW